MESEGSMGRGHEHPPEGQSITLVWDVKSPGGRGDVANKSMQQRPEELRSSESSILFKVKVETTPGLI